MLSTTGLGCVCKTLSTNIANVVGRLLLECYTKVTQLNAWLQDRETCDVFDIVDAGPRHRFTIWTACGPQIVSNCQFGMGAGKLAISLRSSTRDMGISVEQAKEYLALHARAYATYYKWKEQQAHLYFDRKLPMILPCGWYLAAGRRERDKLSVLNFPVQGRGSSIMRLALDKLLEAGIEVVAPVHDAFIFRAKIDELDRICEIAKRCMIEAADEVLGMKGMRVGDPEIVKHGEIWVTEKGERDYETYKWAFEEPTERTIDVPMGDPLDEEF